MKRLHLILRALLLAAALVAPTIWICLATPQPPGPVYPEPWISDYCEGLPPLLGTDC